MATALPDRRRNTLGDPIPNDFPDEPAAPPTTVEDVTDARGRTQTPAVQAVAGDGDAVVRVRCPRRSSLTGPYGPGQPFTYGGREYAGKAEFRVAGDGRVEPAGPATARHTETLQADDRAGAAFAAFALPLAERYVREHPGALALAVAGSAYRVACARGRDADRCQTALRAAQADARDAERERAEAALAWAAAACAAGLDPYAAPPAEWPVTGPWERYRGWEWRPVQTAPADDGGFVHEWEARLGDRRETCPTSYRTPGGAEADARAAIDVFVDGTDAGVLDEPVAG